MNRIRNIVLLTCLAVMGSALAATIGEQQAREIAVRFMAGHSMPSTSLKTAHKAPLTTAATPSGSEKAAYYVFNASGTDRGYVIVAGDDRAPAVLGYSDRGTFDAQNVPPAMQEWLDGYVLQLQAIANGAAPELRSASHEAIAPLLGVRWGQGMPYNVQLPHINGSSNAHAYVGCVAVAMAQVMAYWQYPPRPTTTIPGYTSNSGRTYEVTMPSLQPVDFEWDLMQDTYYTTDSTSAQAQAVATLMRYSTTSLKSSFGLTSTGSFTRYIPERLINYFGYKNSARYIYRESYSTQGWEDVIYAELAEGRPVAYGGNKQSAGHAFVCDGYDGEGMFHINWGWAGKSNGYFLLNLLNPSAEGIGSAAGAYGYVLGQGAAIGLEPGDGTDGTPEFSFEDLSISSSNTTRSSASSAFSVSVSGKFINNTNATAQFRQGWGLYNLDGELLEVLFTRYSTSAVGPGGYITVNARALSFGAGMTSGTYRIKPIYSIYPGEDYKPCVGSDVNYIEVTISGTYSCSVKGYGTAGLSSTTARYTVNDCVLEGTLNHGKPVTVKLNVTNTGTSTNDMIHMLVDGEFTAMGLAGIAPGETGELVYRFTPTTAGTKTLTFSLNESGTPALYTKKVTIATMPAATLDVSYQIQGITDEENRIITADCYSILVNVTNTGTAPYDEDFSVRLYRINNPETNVGTELLNQTQPLTLQPGESKTLQFDFDHDLIDGWKYFCYLYYYSGGETVGTGTKWYQLFLTDTPDNRYNVTTVTTPAAGGKITLAGGNKVAAGDTVTFTVTPASGYTLQNVRVATTSGDEDVPVSLDTTSGIYSFVMPEAAVTVTAAFEEIPVYAITATASPAMGGSYSVSATTAAAGETVTVTTRPNVGWKAGDITVTTGDGQAVTTTSDEGGYTFVMPEATVTVNVPFERATGSKFQLVTTRDSIVEGGIYVIATQYYDKVMKYHEAGETTFGTADVAEWLAEDKTLMRVGDDALFIQMTTVNPDTIRHGSTSGARTNAYLSYGNGYLTTSGGNLVVSENLSSQCRAGMFISSNEYNYLVRFFNEASGASSDFMTVRYDYQGDKFSILNYSSDNQQRVWLYKLVDEAPEEPQVMVGDINGDGTVSISDVTALIDYLLGGGTGINLDAADVNGDENISISDVTTLIDRLLSGN